MEIQDDVRIKNQQAQRDRLSASLDTTAPLVRQPMHLRPGIASPADQDRLAAEAKARRDAPASPQAIAQSFGLSRDFALFIQRLEARVIEQGQEIASLKQAIYNMQPAHLKNLEVR
jgi:hypothetical protein